MTGPHPIDVQDLLLALRAIDPTARIATPIHDEITILCAFEHVTACTHALHAWFTRLHHAPSAGFAQGLPDGVVVISNKWSSEPTRISGREFLEQAPELSEEVVDAIVAARKAD